MFVGFGYLMTFLKAYGLGAVGFTAFITCLGVQWAVLVENIMSNGYPVKVDFLALLNGNFAVAAVLISFGGMIGRIGPTQITVLVLVELLCYSANKVYFLTQFCNIADCGGTIVIHLFGAYFGLACSRALGAATDTGLCTNSYSSDLFSLIGTVFLWLFWPSFVAGALPAGDGQTLALVNTVLALLASTVVTFIMTPVLSNGALTTVPVQNAVLAGGVSIGATANLTLGPFGALLIGALAGAVSTCGFCKPLIGESLDTCGINNLHGMPGVLGGLVSVIVPFVVNGTGVDWKYQLLGTVGTFAVAVVTGGATGMLLKEVGSFETAFQGHGPFSDEAFWDCAEDITKPSGSEPDTLHHYNIF
jgi:ammonium transporter Rh